MKPYFLFLLFFNLAFSQNIFSQRIFMGQLVTEKNDTLKGEIWFGMSGKLPYKTKLVFFSEDGHKVQRFKASKLLSMEVIHDLTDEVHCFEKQGDPVFLVSVTPKEEYRRQNKVKRKATDVAVDRSIKKSRKAAVITMQGDTIWGMYKETPLERILSGKIPVYKADYTPSEVVAYLVSNRKGEYDFFEKKRTTLGVSIFLEPLTKGKLSLYKLENVDISYHIDPYLYYLLCPDKKVCIEVPNLGFRKAIQPYFKDCDIDLVLYKFSYLKALVEDYNKKCGETGK